MARLGGQHHQEEDWIYGICQRCYCSATLFREAKMVPTSKLRMKGSQMWEGIWPEAFKPKFELSFGVSFRNRLDPNFWKRQDAMFEEGRFNAFLAVRWCFLVFKGVILKESVRYHDPGLVLR